MNEFQDAEHVLNMYARQTEGEISELNRTIVALRTKITMLSDQLESERNRIKNLPVPPTVISQIANLNSENAKLDKQIKEKSYEFAEYKKLMIEKILEIQKKKTLLPPSVAAEMADMKTLIAEKTSELEYYKKHAQQSVIINREKVQPTRAGGLRTPPKEN